MTDLKWSLWPCLYWLFWFAAFVAWETYAGVEKMGQKDVPMLTQVVVRYVPWYLTLPALTWLLIHFAVRYMNPAYLKSLRG